jgi:hypothetical protein
MTYYVITAFRRESPSSIRILNLLRHGCSGNTRRVIRHTEAPGLARVFENRTLNHGYGIHLYSSSCLAAHTSPALLVLSSAVHPPSVHLFDMAFAFGCLVSSAIVSMASSNMEFPLVPSLHTCWGLICNVLCSTVHVYN